jgi:prepilin-type N-terminal cleavage/methylation domain-containing protein
MQQRMRVARENEKGFTLIELLIVIVILGILAGIVVFSVQFIQNRGQDAACRTDMKTVQSAIEAFYAQSSNSLYPASINAMVTAGVLKQAPPAADGITYTVDNAANPPVYTLVTTACP